MKQAQVIHFKYVLIILIFILIFSFFWSDFLFAQSGNSDIEPKTMEVYKSVSDYEEKVLTEEYREILEIPETKIEEYQSKLDSLNDFYKDAVSAAKKLGEFKYTEGTLDALSAFWNALGAIGADETLAKYCFKGAIGTNTIGFIITAAKLTYESFKELEKANIDYNFFMAQQKALNDDMLRIKTDNPFSTDVVIRYDSKAVDYYLKKYFLSSPEEFCSFTEKRYNYRCPSWDFVTWTAVWEYENFGTIDKKHSDAIEIWKKEKNAIRRVIHVFLKDFNKVQLARLRAMALRSDLVKLEKYLRREQDFENLKEAFKKIDNISKYLERCNKVATNAIQSNVYNIDFIYKIADCMNHLDEIPPLKIFGIKEKKKKVYIALKKALKKQRKLEAELEHKRRVKILSKKVRGYTLPSMPDIDSSIVDKKFIETYKKYFEKIKGCNSINQFDWAYYYCSSQFQEIRKEIYAEKIKKALKEHKKHITKVKKIIDDLEEAISKAKNWKEKEKLEKEKEHMEDILGVLNERVDYLSNLQKNLDLRLKYLLVRWNNSLKILSDTVPHMNAFLDEQLKEISNIKIGLERCAGKRPWEKIIEQDNEIITPHPINRLKDDIKKLENYKDSHPIFVITPSYIQSKCKQNLAQFSGIKALEESAKCWYDSIKKITHYPHPPPDPSFYKQFLQEMEDIIQKAKSLSNKIESYKKYIEKNLENIDTSDEFIKIASELLGLKDRLPEIINKYNKLLAEYSEIPSLINKAEEKKNEYSQLLEKAWELYKEDWKHYQEVKENEEWIRTFRILVNNNIYLKIQKIAWIDSYDKYKIYTCSSKRKNYTLATTYNIYGGSEFWENISSEKLTEVVETLQYVYNLGIITKYFPAFKNELYKALNFYSNIKPLTTGDYVVFPQNKSIYSKCIFENIYKLLKKEIFINPHKGTNLLKQYGLKPEFLAVKYKKEKIGNVEHYVAVRDYYLIPPNNRDLEMLLGKIYRLIYDYPKKIKNTILAWEEKYKKSEEELKKLKTELNNRLFKLKQGENVEFPGDPEQPQPIRRILNYISSLNDELKSGTIYISLIGEIPLTSQAKNQLSAIRNKFQKLRDEWFDFWEKLQKEIERIANEHRLETHSREAIMELYAEFARCYMDKNLPCILELISENWSAPDGTTIDEMEEILENSFDVFDRIEYKIKNFRIEPEKNGKFKVYYENEIIGYIFSENITHKESYKVVEEVGIKDGKVKILKTLQGQFWKR